MSENELKNAVEDLLAVIDYLTVVDGAGYRYNCWKEDRNLSPYVDKQIDAARALVRR